MLTSRLHRFFVSLAAAIALALAVPAPALAERLGTDVICGQAVSDSGIAESDAPDLTCSHAIVVGQDGTVYFERDADAEVKIASITKVMTAVVALENAKLTDTVTVDHVAATVGESSANLAEGDTMPLSEALKGLMVPSGNDAAIAIATSVGALIDPSSANPYQTFVDAMNKKASELGLSHTVYSNPHGLDDGQWAGELHSTARDVATLFAYAMKNKDFRAIEEDTNDVISVTGADGAQRQIELHRTNKTLEKNGNIGGKTGSTDTAGECFVGAYTRDQGGEIYAVNLGSTSNDARWSDALALANWYYDHVVAYPVATSARTTAEGEPLMARVVLSDWSDKKLDVTVGDSSQTVELFSLAGKVSEKDDLKAVAGAVTKGQEVGTLKVYQGKKRVATAKLVAAEDQAAPSPFEWFMVHVDRLVRAVMGEPEEDQVQAFYTTPDATGLDAAA